MVLVLTNMKFFSDYFIISVCDIFSLLILKLLYKKIFEAKWSGINLSQKWCSANLKSPPPIHTHTHTSNLCLLWIANA